MVSALKVAWRRSVSVAQKIYEKTFDGGASAAAGPEPEKDPNFGVDPTIKTFYAGKNGRNGNFDWVETPPKQLNKKVAKAHDRVGIKVYKITDSDKPTFSGHTPLKIHAIELQSPILVAALKDIVATQGVFLEEAETARFESPFKPLYFCYDEIVALDRRSQEEVVLRDHLRILLQVLKEIFGEMQAQLRNLHASGLISFKLAWTYFPKGSTIYCRELGVERLYKVVDTMTSNLQARLAVTCQDITFNGDSFDWNTVSVNIPLFKGNMPITSLPSYPFAFHKDQEGVKARLIKRAQNVLDYQQLEYREYSGTAGYNMGANWREHTVAGRILIDFYGYCKYCKGPKRNESKPKGENGESSSQDASNIRPLSKEKQQKNKTEMLAREEDLVFMSPILRGYSLSDKLWLEFHVDDIKPVVWNDEAYGHLVYPEEQKDLVLTFVENHQRMNQGGIDDVILGKGVGLVVLLSGPPGSGKTLTAQAVADKSRRPLYYLQAEDLGTNVANLGVNIKRVFEMATEWNAVILLDEADVFMAHRIPSDIARNELVSIFLRELEYYRGIIFLTTNLYDTIDTAFRSRVNIHLYFSALPFSSRLVVWRKFLSRLPPSRIVSDPLTHLTNRDLEELAKWELNGREIKNAIKTVRNWCECKDYAMTLIRLESGILVTSPQAKKVERVDIEEVD